ncbi:MAG TPA: C69 family dipeptidase [Ignavibacteriaceae bacterium]|nr:C69 family dipeptidase [Ignavibacteriaceae bacterium]HPO55821.1 C69 family dipeptidase [Ignavibacteriaceae bacterium]
MKKILIILFLITGIAYSCTNFIVTKGASKEGAVMITYTADSYHMYGELYHSPKGIFSEGTMLSIYEWDTGKFLGKIKQARETYNVVGNMNEHQVVIGETTFGGREELVDPKGIMDYGSLIYIALQRAKTAREAIKIMTELAEEYGYYSSGESFSIGDANEAWILEMIGKGPDKKGAVWVAVRIPDGYVSGHANQARITTFPLNDPGNCIYSKDVISFAREMGYFSGKDSEFNFTDAYNPLSFGGIRFCDARVWSLFRRVNSGIDKYMPYIKGESLERMPLYVKPENKLSVKDVMHLMRDHYEGTELDMTTGVACGPYSMPYRWRPLTFKYQGENYFNERPISTPQTGFSFITQARSDMPAEVGGVIWFGVDDTYMTVYYPQYACATDISGHFKHGVASLKQFSWESAFWVFNFVSNYAYPKYSLIIDDIKTEQSKHEGFYIAEQQNVEKKALTLLKNSRSEAVEFLTNHSKETADKLVKDWRNFGEFLVMKYNDGVVKDEYGNPINVGYPEEFKKRMVDEAGDKIKMKQVQPEIDQSYTDAVRTGDEMYKAKKFEDALKSYRNAANIKPGETYPKLRIEKIENLLKVIEKEM